MFQICFNFLDGELAVSIVQIKNKLTGTEDALLGDKEFPAELEKGCAQTVLINNGFIHCC